MERATVPLFRQGLMVNPEFIYIIDVTADATKYARGRAGERAKRVVKQTYGRLGGEPPGLRGVTGRKPVIPEAARKLSRRAAGRPLCRALGLEYW